MFTARNITTAVSRVHDFSEVCPGVVCLLMKSVAREITDHVTEGLGDKAI